MKELKSSVHKTFAVLENFTVEKPEWSVTDLAKEMESNKSTIYRFLSDLEKSGAIYQNQDTGKYGLGLKIFELGSRVRIQSAFVEKTHPALLKVAQAITETVHIAALYNKQVYYVDKVKSPQGLTVSTSIGSYRPLHNTSLGKVLLAFNFDSYEDILEQEYLDEELKAYTENTITDHSVLQKELAAIRQKGFALDREEYELGLICVAVPIFNQKNELVASLSAAGPASRFKEQELKNYVKILQEGASEIKNRIGDFKL